MADEEKAYSHDDLLAERDKRLAITQQYAQRELVDAVARRTGQSHHAAEQMARPHFDRLTPREDGDVDVRLHDGGVEPSGLGGGSNGVGIAMLAGEIARRELRKGVETNSDAILERKRRGSVFRNGMA